MTTPKKIESLKENEIFVFGSNLNGNHAGGAAKQAQESFGAINGIGEGIMGQSYAFPTLDKKMKKVSEVSLYSNKNKLYEYAKENPTKTFLVTKVGCGIAGFTEDEMKKIFKGDKPKNVILPAGWAKVYGYKAFEKGLKCRGFQYELGKDFNHKGEISLCHSGFHFCKSLGNVYSYYLYGNDIVVAEIESEGDVIDEDGQEKSVTNHIRITRILNAEEASNNNGLDNLGHSNTGDRNTGDRNTGDRNTGDRNTGDRNTGDRNTGNSNTGNSNTGQSNTGNSNTGHSNTGNRNTGDWNTGDRNTGSFNTITPDKVLVFNKECDTKKWKKAEKPNCLFFNVNKWVQFSDMTDEEKENIGTAKYTGGYMKKLDYKKAFSESLAKASKEDLELIKKLPNFDSKIFEEISGFKLK